MIRMEEEGEERLGSGKALKRCGELEEGLKITPEKDKDEDAYRKEKEKK